MINFNEDNFMGNDLESTNYDDSEFVFSQNNERMEIPKLYSCNTCRQPFIRNISKSESEEQEILEQEQCETCNIKSNKWDCVIKSDENKEKKEHMTDTASPSLVFISLIPYLVIIIFCFLLAASRKELTISSGFCIFFFPYMYISYVLIDFFVIRSSQ